MLRLKTRRFVFRFMVVSYLLTAAAVILLGNGYRVHLNPFRISSTGNVLVTYIPTDATVFLDGLTTGATSPARLRAVFPGTHMISIQRDGYLPYRHAISVEAQKTTFVTDAYLVRDAAPDRISTTSSTTALPIAEVFASTLVVNGHTISVSSSPQIGTVIVSDDIIVSRDLGYGSWHVIGGDKVYVAIARTDTNETQFRLWDSIDTVAFTVSGTSIISEKFKNKDLHVIYSPFELWVVDTDQKSATLISRVSKPISKVVLLPNTTLAFVMFQDEIVAYQLADQLATPQSILTGVHMIDIAASSDDLSLIYKTKEGDDIATFSRLIQ